LGFGSISDGRSNVLGTRKAGQSHQLHMATEEVAVRNYGAPPDERHAQRISADVVAHPSPRTAYVPPTPTTGPDSRAVVAVPIPQIPTSSSATLDSNVWGAGPTGVLVYMNDLGRGRAC
jgi:hypothetical protein